MQSAIGRLDDPLRRATTGQYTTLWSVITPVASSGRSDLPDKRSFQYRKTIHSSPLKQWNRSNRFWIAENRHLGCRSAIQETDGSIRSSQSSGTTNSLLMANLGPGGAIATGKGWATTAGDHGSTHCWYKCRERGSANTNWTMDQKMSGNATRAWVVVTGSTRRHLLSRPCEEWDMLVRGEGRKSWTWWSRWGWGRQWG